MWEHNEFVVSAPVCVLLEWIEKSWASSIYCLQSPDEHFSLRDLFVAGDLKWVNIFSLSFASVQPLRISSKYFFMWTNTWFDHLSHSFHTFFFWFLADSRKREAYWLCQLLMHSKISVDYDSRMRCTAFICGPTALMGVVSHRSH